MAAEVAWHQLPHAHARSPPTCRFRELGCACAAVKGADYKEGKSYTVTLLAAPARGGEPKTLAECLPKPKGPPRARR